MLEASAVGPFFAVRTGGPGTAAGRVDQGYLPFAEVYATGGTVWPRHMRSVGDRLGTDETRVAGSIAFQGIAARLWSVGLGSAALTGRVPDLAPERLYWNPGRTAPDDLWLPDAAAVGAPAVVHLRDTVLHGHLLELHRATRAVCRVSERLLWGNAASALAGALLVLDGWCRAAGRAEAADRALALTRELLADPPLRGTGTLEAGPGRSGPSAGPAFHRRSCCLYYRVPGGGLCGDCVLLPRRGGV